jgi:hypothetical protein
VKNQSKILSEEERDLWYKKMGDRIPIKPEDELVVGMMEWVDLTVRYNCRE